MKKELALRVLSSVMDWDDARAIDEFRWLSLMSRLKYDGYQDFLAGVRFIESLATWMQQFEHPEEREQAYAFVRHRLVYIGPAEMLRLVELFYPGVEQRLVRAVAEAPGVPAYLVWAKPNTAAAYHQLLRRTLFIGLSEGARLDLFRRANAGVVSNEQVLLATYADATKWDTLLEDLRKDLKDSETKFRFVYLIDDFTGSGTTFIRKKEGKWKGKLIKFLKTAERFSETHFEQNLTVCVHHYMASHRAAEILKTHHAEASAELEGAMWFPNVEFTFGTILPPTLPIDRSQHREAQAFISLARKYCDREDSLLKNNHFDEGDTRDAALGFADCALPLVFEHNTPNNSVALLWAETAGSDGMDGRPNRHAMRPLFRRRQRHA
jgi:hypothetical protein